MTDPNLPKSAIHVGAIPDGPRSITKVTCPQCGHYWVPSIPTDQPSQLCTRCRKKATA